MRKNNVNIFIITLAFTLLTSLWGVPAVIAQTAGNDPTICYRITSLPTQGFVTNTTDANMHEDVMVGDFFIFPTDLVYTAPNTPSVTGGPYELTYEVADLSFEPTPTGVGTCSNGGQACDPPFNSPSNCVQGFCIEDIIIIPECGTSPILDAAMVTFNISNFDPCPSVGRDGGCGPDVPK